MDHEPIFIQETECDWETWKDADLAAKSSVYWKTLISGDKTDSHAITMGISEIPLNEKLFRHRHIQPEVYFILEGTGIMVIQNEERTVIPQTAIFIPGDMVHSLENTGSTPLRFLYVFSVDSFDDVKYIFEDAER